MSNLRILKWYFLFIEIKYEFYLQSVYDKG